MEGQDVDSLHVSQIGGKPRNLGNVLSIVCESRNEHEAYPYRYSASGQSPGKIQNWPNLHTRKLTMKFWIPAFEIEQDEVNVFQIRIGKAITQSTVGI